MPTSPCPWCGEPTDARHALELKKEFTKIAARSRAMERFVESLRDVTWRTKSSLGRLQEDEWDDRDLDELIANVDKLLSEIDKGESILWGY